jgi:MOSC domain-containing protein YiiM
MRVIKSVNIGLPKEVYWQERKIWTGIFKYPTDQVVRITHSGITGDGQADLIYHGGADKAVYAYPLEHYTFWKQYLKKDYLEAGAFGENLTTEGLMDTEVYMGDYFQMGTAVLMAVQPRMPCSKLGLRFNDASMTKHFAQARRNGVYFRVIQEGALQAGDSITLVRKSEYPVTIQDVVDCYAMPKKNPEMVRRIMNIPFLPQMLRSSFEYIIKQ